MENTKKKEREYTDKQKLFLDVVMDEDHKGNIRKAMQTAGYAPSVPTSVIINSLGDELREAAKKVIAANVLKATYATLDIIDNPAEIGAQNKLKAAHAILERAGVKEDTSQDINLKVPSGGLVILPAKTTDVSSEDKVE